jgi:hypothetical protein
MPHAFNLWRLNSIYSWGHRKEGREKVGKGERKRLNTYCLRKSANLEVRADISPKERRMSSLSFGSSHNSAIFRASAKAPRICSSPSGPPFGSASQFYIQKWRRIMQPTTHESHLIKLNKRITNTSEVITFRVLLLIVLQRLLAKVRVN